MLADWVEVVEVISIHALRKESDLRIPPYYLAQVISIHALRKESDIAGDANRRRVYRFQSTLSVRRATDGSGFALVAVCISIHALCKESDCLSVYGAKSTVLFQSTLSVRRATSPSGRMALDTVTDFNPRSP